MSWQADERVFCDDSQILFLGATPTPSTPPKRSSSSRRSQSASQARAATPRHEQRRAHAFDSCIY